MKQSSFFFILALALFWACDTTNSNEEQSKPLPILGNHNPNNGDTIFHTIPKFQFINQDSQKVSNATFKDKAYVVDFFFTSCPTICPKIKKQMLRIHEKFEYTDKLSLLSHTIDTKRDTIAKLKEYADNLEVAPPKWHFVTGDKDDIYAIADDYFSVTIEDPNAPGGFDHSGRLILVDKQGHIRSFCNGTEPEGVDKLIADIEILLKEME